MQIYIILICLQTIYLYNFLNTYATPTDHCKKLINCNHRKFPYLKFAVFLACFVHRLLMAD